MTSNEARHAKTISVGNAASLFGAPSAEEDFFGGLASKPPAFDVIGEADEEEPEATTNSASPPREVASDLFGSKEGDAAAAAATTTDDWLAPTSNGYVAQQQPAYDAYAYTNGYEGQQPVQGEAGYPYEQPVQQDLYSGYSSGVNGTEQYPGQGYEATEYQQPAYDGGYQQPQTDYGAYQQPSSVYHQPPNAYQQPTSDYDEPQYAYYPPSEPAAQPLPPSAPAYGASYDPYAAPAAINRTAAPYSIPPPQSEYNDYAYQAPPIQPYQAAPPPPRVASPQALPPAPKAPYARTGAYSPPPPKPRAVTSPISPKKNRFSTPAIPSPVVPPPRPTSAASETFAAPPPPRRGSSAMASHAHLAHRDSLPSVGQALYGPAGDEAITGPPRRASMASLVARPPSRTATPSGIPLPASPSLVSYRHSISPPPELSLSPPTPHRHVASPPPSLAVSPPSPEFAPAAQSAWANQEEVEKRVVTPTMDVLADLEGPAVDELDPYANEEPLPETPGKEPEVELYGSNDAYGAYATSSDPYGQVEAEQPRQLEPAFDTYDSAYAQESYDPYASSAPPPPRRESYDRYAAAGPPPQASYDPYGAPTASTSAFDPYTTPAAPVDEPSMTYAQYRHYTQSSMDSGTTSDSAGGSGYGGDNRSRSASGGTSRSYAGVEEDDAETPHASFSGQTYAYGEEGGGYAPSRSPEQYPARGFAQPPIASPFQSSQHASPYAPTSSSYDSPSSYSAPPYVPQASSYEPSPYLPQTSPEAPFDPYAQPAYEQPEVAPPAPVQRYSPAMEDNGYGPSASQLDPYEHTAFSERSRTTSPASATARSNGPDPLGRDRRTLPVVSFGFGGKLVTCFPSSNFSTFSATTPVVSVRSSWPEMVEEDVFPGPLYLDSGWNKAVQAKKRKDVVGWLERRIEERGKVAMYAAAASTDEAEVKRREATDRGVLLRLLKALIEGEGKLSGSPAIDQAVRLAILPEAKDVAPLPTAADLHQGASSLIGTGALISSSEIHESDLDRLQSMLVKGDRTGAMRFALDRKLWGHALVLASSLDKDAWREAVNELIRSDLAQPPPQEDDSNGRESLRVAYALFAGLSGAATYEFSPPWLSSQLRSTAPPTAVPSRSLTPAPAGATTVTGPSRAPTPASAFIAPPPSLSASTLSRWQETAATIVANRVAGDTQALGVLGDTLAANGWIDAAHCCYLLSSPTALFGGVGQAGAKIVLLGVDANSSSSALQLDSDAIALTEVVEFALSLAPTVKGQEAFAGLPHLQAFRLAQAARLADLGHTAQAQRYCEAIGGTLKLATKMSPYYHTALVEQVKHFSERLVGVSSDKSSSWISKAMTRPKLDSLWSNLEDRVSKFVAGEGESDPAAVRGPNGTVLHGGGGAAVAAKAVGPFSHYSAISPASTNATVSRASSNSDLGTTAAGQAAPPFTAMPPPPRPSSAQQRKPPAARSKPPPVTPRGHGHKKSMSLGYLAYSADPYAGSTPKQPTSYEPSEVEETPRARPHSFDQPDRPMMNDENAEGGWWGAASGYSAGGVGNEEDASAQHATLRAPSFATVDESFAEDDSGFISPMGASTPALNASTSSTRMLSAREEEMDDPEDLGFGNARSKRDSRVSASEGDAGKSTTKADEEPQRPSIKPATSSWGLSRWFKREGSPAPGSVKANMGEESTFVFDPELKRWVNKKAGAPTEAAPGPTPPPPRAQTVSPVSSMRAERPPRFLSATPPPLPASRAPVSAASSAAPTPPPPSLSAPPAQRKVTAPAKKGGRRYVDVM